MARKKMGAQPTATAPRPRRSTNKGPKGEKDVPPPSVRVVVGTDGQIVAENITHICGHIVAYDFRKGDLTRARIAKWSAQRCFPCQHQERLCDKCGHRYTRPRCPYCQNPALPAAYRARVEASAKAAENRETFIAEHGPDAWAEKVNQEARELF